MTNTESKSKGEIDYLEWGSEKSQQAVEKKIKYELLYRLADEIGTGAELIRFWDKQRRGHDSSDQEQSHHDAARHLWDEGFIPECLPDIMEHWNANDWRGKKGQRPTPMQFFEEALKWRAHLNRTGSLFLKSIKNPEQVRTGVTWLDSTDNDKVSNQDDW